VERIQARLYVRALAQVQALAPRLVLDKLRVVKEVRFPVVQEQ
jgi:hypothetical protein